MTSSLRAALDEAKQSLTDLYGERLARVVLYGSQARGDAQPDSDVDLLVVVRGAVEPLHELKRLVPLRQRLLAQYEADVSIQPFEEAVYEDPDHPLMQNVRAEGIEL